MLNNRPVLLRRLFYFLVYFIFFSCFVSFLPAQQADLVIDIFKHTNQFRKSNGKTSLLLRDDLNEIARKHSADMASGRKSIGHGGFQQREALIRRKLNTMGIIGENVAFGANTAKEVVTLWKNSPAHRKNMLGNYRFIGIGTASDRKGNIYFTQIFVH
jgi:uncharacterized protein YkwD